MGFAEISIQIRFIAVLLHPSEGYILIGILDFNINYKTWNKIKAIAFSSYRRTKHAFQQCYKKIAQLSTGAEFLISAYNEVHKVADEAKCFTTVKENCGFLSQNYELSLNKKL